MAPLRPCLDCGTPAAGNRCAVHQAQRDQLDNARRHAKQRAHGRDTAEWRNLRSRALARDNHTCQLRQPGCTRNATIVHLDPTLNGQHRGATLADVTSACHHCSGKIDGPRSARPKPTTGLAGRDEATAELLA